MKRRLAVILAVILTIAMITGTVAYADNGSKIGNAIDKAQQRLDFLKKIQPLIEQIQANRQQIVSLRADLKNQRQLAQAHIAQLKTNPGSLTQEQLQAMQTITAQIKECRKTLSATNPQMEAARQSLRAARKSKDYDAVLAAYNSVIALQGTRVEQINKLIGLYKQVQGI